MSEDLKAMFRRLRKKDLAYYGNLGSGAQGGSGGGALPDITAPSLSSAEVPSAGTTIVLTYNENLLSTGDGVPDTTDYTISASGGAVTVSSRAVSTTTVTLTLSRTISQGETVTISYTAGASGRVQDASLNISSNFTNQAVTNNSTVDTTAPTISTAVVPAAGTTLGLTYNENLLASGDGIPDIADYSITSGGTLVTISAVSVSGAIVTLNLARTITSGETLSFNYTAGASGRVQDAANNVASNLTSQAVTNNAGDIVAPVLTNPVDDNAGSTDGALTVDTDEGNGTLYWVISTSSTAPSKAQVKAGQMHTGAAAADSGSQAVSGTGTQTISGESGLTESTTYYAHFMHEDSSANQSDVVSGNGFTTDAGGEVATFSGAGVFYPPLAHPSYQISTTNGIATTAYTMDAATEKVAFIGTVYIDGRPAGAKTLSTAGSVGKIHFLPGPATFADTTGSPTTIRVGIQDLDDTAGGSGAGVGAAVDGSFDVYGDLVAGTHTITTSTWKTVSMTSGTKDITHGQKVAIVFDMTVRGGGNTDSVQVSGVSIQVANAGWPQVQHYTASWARQSSLPICIIEFDDGTLGTIAGGLPVSAISGYTYSSSSTPDEYGVLFQLPFESTATSLWMIAKPTTNAANGELILYSDPLGTPVAEATISLDANNFQLTDGVRFGEWVLPTAKTLAANTDYAVAFRPTTTTNVTLTYFTLPDATYRKFLAGTNVSRAHRTDNAGAFTSTTTVHPMIGVKLG
jgi:uncharacterized repeat protein (TIGR02059 family)